MSAVMQHAQDRWETLVEPADDELADVITDAITDLESALEHCKDATDSAEYAKVRQSVVGIAKWLQEAA